MSVEQKILTFPLNPAPLIEVHDPLLKRKKINLFIKREDLIHPFIFGNKWYKLKYNLIEAERQKKKTILTFGGAYSNHIYAVSAAGKLFGFKTIGIIRGEEHLPLNPILKFAAGNRMLINYVNRSAYRKRNEPEFIELLHKTYGDFYLLPEGGTNELAVKGSSEIHDTINIKYDYLCVSCGTGGTIAGLISANKPDVTVLGFSALKGGEFLINQVKKLVNEKGENENWKMFFDYHFGGYAKTKKVLNDFLYNFYEQNNFKADRIYFGKALYGVYDLIRQNYFPENKTIIIINSAPVE